MNAKKFIAVFVVLVMALSATACIVSFVPETQATTIRGDEMVTLDVDKDFAGNADELKKLGIRSADSWKYTESTGYKGYILKLNDLVYITSAPSALKVVSSNPDTIPHILYVECKGDCRMVAEGVDATKYSATTCIDAYNETNKVGICFIGDGVFTAECNNKTACNSVAIYASLLGVKGCTLNAISSDIELSDEPKRTANIATDAISITQGMLISEGASVYATAGNIRSTYEGLTGINYATSGLYSSNTWNGGATVIINEGYLCATGGNIDAYTANVAGTIGAYFDGGLVITDSVVEFNAGNITVGGIGASTSEALVMKGNLTATHSVITAMAGDIDVSATLGELGQIYTSGIKCTPNERTKSNTIKLERTIMFAQGGELSCETAVISELFFSAGLISMTLTDFSVELKSSIFGAIAGESSDYSYGFVIMDNNFEIASGGSLTLDDSEFDTYGKTRALAIGSITCVEEKNVKWCGYEKNGQWHQASPKELTTVTGATSVFVGYNSLVYLRASEDEQADIDVKRISGDTYELPECEFTAPEGKQFKCWSVDGKEYMPGQTIDVDYPYIVVTAVWEKTGSSGGDNTGIIIMAVAVMLIALFILAMIFVPAKK